MIPSPITPHDLAAHLETLAPDGITRFSLGREPDHPLVLGFLIHGSRTLAQMQANHQLGPIESYLLGKGLLGAGLLAAMLKNEGMITVRVDSASPAEGFAADAMRDPSGAISVRGRLFVNPLPEEALSLDSARAIFQGGSLTVIRTEAEKRPFHGSVALRTGDLGKDLTWYFLESEQTHAAVDMGVSLRRDGYVDGAGALLLTAMPGTDDEFLAEVESCMQRLPPLGMWFANRGSRDLVLFSTFAGLHVERSEEQSFIFGCPCSHDRFLSRLAALDAAALEHLLSSGPWPLETVCHYCNSKYLIEKEALLAAIEAGSQHEFLP